MNNKKMKYEEELEKYRKVVIDCLNHTQDSEKYVYLMKKESNLQNKLIKLGISSGKLNSIWKEERKKNNGKLLVEYLNPTFENIYFNFNQMKKKLHWLRENIHDIDKFDFDVTKILESEKLIEKANKILNETEKSKKNVDIS